MIDVPFGDRRLQGRRGRWLSCPSPRDRNQPWRGEFGIAEASVRTRLSLALVVGLIAFAALPALALARPTPAVIPMRWGPAGGDCSGQIALTSVPSRLHYTVWCGVESGPVHFSVRGPKGKRPLAFDRKPRAIGPGASGLFRCRRSDREITCRGRASGPLTITGTLTLAGVMHCSEHARLDVGDGYYGGRPSGCPGSRERPPPFAGVKRFRREYGLDVLPQDVPNATDRGPVADRAVASGVVVVLEPVWQGLGPMGG
jgi:hypothetical protein